MTILSQEFVFRALDAENSGEAFPIDFDDVYPTLGYSTKQKAEEALVSNLILNEDFLTLGLKSSTGGRPAKDIRLSTDGFDHFAMMAQTPEGRQARKEFIAYKKAYKTSLERAFSSQLEDERYLLISSLNDAEAEVLTLQQKLEQLQIESAKLKADLELSIGNHLEFSYSLEQLHKDSLRAIFQMLDF